ncbi:MAG: hypothetical protein KAJ51_03770, partial [Thermoplasmata archaeon]|nr:hypothetical protein [Thermoplasmata archaeon]
MSSLNNKFKFFSQFLGHHFTSGIRATFVALYYQDAKQADDVMQCETLHRPLKLASQFDGSGS